MKLAEALMTRGTLQNKINELRGRLRANAVVQEGEAPAEDPKELLVQANTVLNELENLIVRINRTNAATVADGVTMTAMLARRERMQNEIALCRDFLDNASMTGQRSRGSEIRLVSTVPVSELQKKLDSKAQELRKLEIRIQELNWITELGE